MMHSYLARRWIAGFAILMLLLCQTAAAAFACIAPSAAPSMPLTAMDAAAPCHQAAHDTSEPAPAHGCQDRCPSRDASFETTKIDIPAAATQVLTLFAVNPPDSGVTVKVSYEQIAANATPPPLLLVYCRLLI